MCSAIRFFTSEDPLGVYHCHCKSCRRHTGAPLSTMAVYRVDQVEFSGETRQWFDTSPGVKRGYCGKCGSSMTWETDHPRFGKICSLHISTFDNPNILKPEAHSFYGEKLTWVDVRDELPRYEGLVKISQLISYGPNK